MEALINTWQSCRKHVPEEFAATKAHLLLFVTQTLGSPWCLLFYTHWAAERLLASVREVPGEPPAPSLCSLPGAPGLTQLAGRFLGEPDTEGPRAVPSDGEEADYREQPAGRLLPPGGGQECLRDKIKDV